jgi:hypothetical protein
MDDRLWEVGNEVKRLSREVDDAEWDGDPRLAQLVRELERFKKLESEGVTYEPKF